MIINVLLSSILLHLGNEEDFRKAVLKLLQNPHMDMAIAS